MVQFDIVNYSILGFGGCFCLVWSFGLALQRNSQSKWIAVTFVSLSGFRLVWESFVLSGLVTHFLDAFALGIPALYLIGPSLMLYYEKLRNSNPLKRIQYHSIPLVVSLLPFFFWFSLDSWEKINIIADIQTGKWNFPNFIFLLWILGPKISIFGYAIFTARQRSGEGMAFFQSLPQNIRSFSRFLLYYTIIMILTDIFGYTIGIPILSKLSAWSHAIVAPLVYLYSRANPQVMLEIEKAIQAAKYSNSKLRHIDPEKAIQKMQYLMEKESYYADEDLRLPILANAMEISPHQLSELVNVNFACSFSQWVHMYRTKVACQMLEEETRNILSIGFAVGFNSKSAFNRVFRTMMGCSPTEYKKNPQKYQTKKEIILQKLKTKL